MILNEFSKLKIEKVPADELERSKNLIIGGILRGMDNPQEALEIIAYLEMQYKSEKRSLIILLKLRLFLANTLLMQPTFTLMKERFQPLFSSPKNNLLQNYF